MTETPRRFGVSSTKNDAPIAFELFDTDTGTSIGVFHATRKPRLDIIQAMAAAVDHNEQGLKVYNIDVLSWILREIVIRERWNPTRERWEFADDASRMAEVLRSDRWKIDVDQMGEIVLWLMEEVSHGEHPTGGPRPSSDGPIASGTTSTDLRLPGR